MNITDKIKDHMKIFFITQSLSSLIVHLLQCLQNREANNKTSMDIDLISDDDKILLYLNTASFVYLFLANNLYKHSNNLYRYSIYNDDFLEKIKVRPVGDENKNYNEIIIYNFIDCKTDINIVDFYQKLPAVKYLFASAKNECENEMLETVKEIFINDIYETFIETACILDQKSLAVKKLYRDEILYIVEKSLQEHKEVDGKLYYYDFPFSACSDNTFFSDRYKILLPRLAVIVLFLMMSHLTSELYKKNEKCFLDKRKSFNDVEDRLNRQFISKKIIDYNLLYKDFEQIENEHSEAFENLSELIWLIAPLGRGDRKYSWSKKLKENEVFEKAKMLAFKAMENSSTRNRGELKEI